MDPHRDVSSARLCRGRWRVGYRPLKYWVRDECRALEAANVTTDGSPSAGIETSCVEPCSRACVGRRIAHKIHVDERGARCRRRDVVDSNFTVGGSKADQIVSEGTDPIEHRRNRFRVEAGTGKAESRARPRLTREVFRISRYKRVSQRNFGGIGRSICATEVFDG